MLADLLSESYEVDLEESWENERAATSVRAFAVCLHETSCSLGKTTIFAELDVDRSHGAVWNWAHRLAASSCDPPTGTPSRVAVDETAVKIDGERFWLSAAIDTKTKLIHDVALFGRHGTDTAAAFLHHLREKHDLSEAEFLVDQFGYRTALSRLGLSGRINYTERNLIEKWFHTLETRIDRFHHSWVGSRSSAREWREQLMCYYTRQRPHQAPERRKPIEEVQN